MFFEKSTMVSLKSYEFLEKIVRKGLLLALLLIGVSLTSVAVFPEAFASHQLGGIVDPQYPSNEKYLKFTSEFKFSEYLNNLKSDAPYSGLMPIASNSSPTSSSSLGWKCFSPYTMYSDGTKYSGESWCHNGKDIIILDAPKISLLDIMKKLNSNQLEIVNKASIVRETKKNTSDVIFDEKLLFCKNIADTKFCYADVGANNFLDNYSISQEQSSMIKNYFSKNSQTARLTLKNNSPTENSISVENQQVVSSFGNPVIRPSVTKSTSIQILSQDNSVSVNSIDSTISKNYFQPPSQIERPDIVRNLPSIDLSELRGSEFNLNTNIQRPTIVVNPTPYSPSINEFRQMQNNVREWYVPEYDPFGITGKSMGGFYGQNGISQFRDYP